MDKDKLVELIETRLEGKEKVSCKEALNWAEEWQVPPKKLTEIFNEKKIKVYGCQLGCF